MITALQIVFLITFFVFQTQFISKYCRKHALYYLLLIIFSLIAFQFVQNGQIFALSVAFIPLILSFSVEILSFYIQKHRLQQSFLNFLDKMILKMQNGTSFQVTLSEIYLESDAFLQQKAFLYDHFVLFRTQNIKFLNVFDTYILDQLRFIEKNPHMAYKFLVSWREIEKIRTYFRRKSGQLSFQSRFQSILSLGMYFVFLMLQLSVYTWRDLDSFVLISFPLFILGFYLTQALGRRLKWNI